MYASAAAAATAATSPQPKSRLSADLCQHEDIRTQASRRRQLATLSPQSDYELGDRPAHCPRQQQQQRRLHSAV
ncbi:hypothetical protein DFH11DRAFT_1883371, partial [Phellopilus nigrolimitatus]